MGKGINKDFIQLLLLVVVSIFVVYFTSGIVARLFFLVLLPFVWFSKRDYFWFAFFFLLLNQPGGLFSGGDLMDEKRLPLYKLGPGLSLMITDLYFLLIFVKAFVNRSLFINKLKLEFGVLMALFLMLFIISFGYDFSINSIAQTIRVAINCTLFYSVLFIFRDLSVLTVFFRSVFPFVFFAVGLQIFGLTFKMQPIEFLKAGSVQNLYAGAEFGLEERPIEMVGVVFVAFCGTLLMLSLNKVYRFFSERYLLIINLTGLLSMVLSGTRSWTVGFFAAWLFFLLISKGRMIKYFFQGIFTVILLLGVFTLVPVLNKQLVSAWERITTVTRVVEGDTSLGGSAQRYQVYAPKLIDDFSKSNPFFGAGFSDFYYTNANIHVGYHNILLHSGIVGVLFHLWFYFRVFKRTLFSSSQIRKVAFIPFLIFILVNFGVQVIGWGVIHQYFFAIQAFAFAFLFAGDRVSLKPIYTQR
jgi:hypothetical protein